MRKPLSLGKRLCWILAIMIYGGVISLAQAAIRVEADRSPIVLGEEFELIFSIESPVSLQEPDFSPLEPLFQIKSRSSGQNVVILNGQMTRSITWRLRLLARTAGTMTVPAIDFGSRQSSPLTLRVIDANELLEKADPLAGAGQDIIVEVQAQTEEPYVQQQVIILQRLWHAVPLHSNRAHLSVPEVAKGKGLLKPLGRAKNLTMNRNGKRYQVIERRYALFPQSSGELMLSRSVFEGVIDTSSRGQRFNFDPFVGSGERVRRFSKPLAFNVKPQEKVSSGDPWLPARQLSINTYWDRTLNQLKPGDPVNLTVAVVADGLTAEQLPALKMIPPVGVKAYPGEAELSNQVENETILGMRQEKWVFVPTKAGSYTLPEVQVAWWNTQEKRAELATMPSHLLTVSGTGGLSSAQAGTRIETPSNPPDKGLEPDLAEAGKAGVTTNTLDNQQLLEEAPRQTLHNEQPVSIRIPPLWMLLAGFLVLSSLLVFLLQRRHKKADHTQVSGMKAMQRLEKACHENDSRAAYEALKAWLRDGLQLSPPTLDNLRKRASPELKRALDELSAVLYASNRDLWQGKALLQAIKHHPAHSATPEHRGNALEVLYPD